ncbi:MAG: hypothetical protein ACOC2L_00020 [Candidatus Sumerlaeota bacterium]
MLSKKEMREKNSKETLVTIMDERREAGFALIAMNATGDVRYTLNMLGDEPEAKAVMAMESIDAAGPNEYEDYQRISHGAVMFAGVPMAELRFQGRKPGKDLRWYRILILTGGGSNDTILLILSSTPKDEKGLYYQDFKAIEDSWQWK